MGRPRLYSDVQRREKRRLKQRKWRAANPERAREITRESERRRAAKRALAEGRQPGTIGRPVQFTEQEKKAKRASKSRAHYHNNRAKLAPVAAKREREKRAAIRAGEYVPQPWGGVKLTRDERQLRDRAMGSKRRTRLKSVGGNYTADDIKELRVRQKGNCAWCLLPLGDDYHIDHYLPVILDGPNDIGNLRLLHPKCNLIKAAHHPIDHALKHGMLCW
jgi:5-methylcytosine-specific restriction endonuclease McrA